MVDYRIEGDKLYLDSLRTPAIDKVEEDKGYRIEGDKLYLDSLREQKPEESPGYRIEGDKLYMDSLRPEASPEPTVTAEAPTREPENMDRIEGRYKEKYAELNYSEDDLVADEYFAPIERYMVARYGSHMANQEKYDRREVVEMFLNNMRGFAAGNTVRAVNEVSYLYSIEDQNELEAIAEGYALYENLPHLFSGEVSVSEGAEIVQDFVRSTVLDPSNLIGGVIGWVVGGAGTKAGTLKIQLKKSLVKFLLRPSWTLLPLFQQDVPVLKPPKLLVNVWLPKALLRISCLLRRMMLLSMLVLTTSTSRL